MKMLDLLRVWDLRGESVGWHQFPGHLHTFNSSSKGEINYIVTNSWPVGQSE